MEQWSKEWLESKEGAQYMFSRLQNIEAFFHMLASKPTISEDHHVYGLLSKMIEPLKYKYAVLNIDRMQPPRKPIINSDLDASI